MDEWESLFQKLDNAAKQTGFSGVLRVDEGDGSVFAQAYGFADRAYQIPNTSSTRYSVASVTKGFTALVIGSLIDEGLISLETPVRQFLGADLPLIDDAVTIGHLLTHRSGIGDYLEESESEDFNDYVMPVPVHTMDSTEHYLPALAGHVQALSQGSGLNITILVLRYWR